MNKGWTQQESNPGHLGYEQTMLTTQPKNKSKSDSYSSCREIILILLVNRHFALYDWLKGTSQREPHSQGTKTFN